MFKNQEIQVVIQNSAKSHAVKHKPIFPLFTVEKFLASHLYYPCNEGLILGEKQGTKILVITPVPVLPGAIILCRSIGSLDISDKKIIAVPVSKLTNLYDEVHTIHDLPALILQQIQDFYAYIQPAVA